MTLPDKSDFLVSYTSPDRAWAEWIAWQLESAGFTTSVLAWDFLPGRSFAQAISDATGRAERTLVVLSPAFFESRYTGAEWAAVFATNQVGVERILPVRVRASTPPGLLDAITYLDLVGLDESSARDQLLATVQASRATSARLPLRPDQTSERSAAPGFPDDAPSIFNAPHMAGTFVGREQDLAVLRSVLARERVTATTHAAIVTGIGGVGKTQLAAQFAHRYRADYDVVWWMQADFESQLLADYTDLGVKLGLPEASEADHASLVEATRAWLERSGRWLLIFDNAADPDSLSPLLPMVHGGHVLITSRRRAEWSSLADLLELGSLTRDQSVELLLDRTGSQDREAAERIAESLGDLPLALEQAAAYINQRAIPPSVYLERLASAVQQPGRSAVSDYPGAVARTLELAVERLAAFPAAGELLRICAYLGSDRIPRELLAGDLARLLDLPDSALVDDALAMLVDYSLLVPGGDDTFSMHRLVQLLVRERGTPEVQRASAAVAVMLVGLVFPQDGRKLEFWPRCDRLISHALVVTDHAQALEVALEATAVLLMRVAFYMHARAETVRARELLERVLAIEEQIHGTEHPAVARALFNLGNIHTQLGELATSRVALERALAIEQRAHGPDDPEVARTLGSLGDLLLQTGELQTAREALQRALAIQERAYGNDHEDVATTLGNLGNLYLSAGELDAARVAHERSLKIKQRLFGEQSPQVARTLANLGNTLREQGDLTGARAALERAATTFAAVYGAQHHETARALANLGMVLQNLGDLHAARANLEQALAVLEQAYGPDHPAVAGALENLSNTLDRLGDVPEARTALERVLRIEERTYGPEHAGIAATLRNLGRVQLHMGDLLGARGVLERALAIEERTYGGEHPEVASTLGYLSWVLEAQGDLLGARGVLERALAIEERTYGGEHPEVASTLCRQGHLLRRLGDLAGARGVLERALAIEEQAYGSEHPEVAGTLRAISEVLEAQDDLPAARGALERAPRIEERDYGPEHPELATTLSHLGEILRRLGNLSAAYATAERALTILERTYGPGHPETRQARELLNAAGR